MKEFLALRKIEESDCEVISKAFADQGWDKPVSQYRQYLAYQTNKQRDVIIATINAEFAGYVLINWKSDYQPFLENDIPEIVDFNVLKKYQRSGIGTSLMDEAEHRISKTFKVAGIGFGLYEDYGPAQILYVRRGYIPLGTGVIKNGETVIKGEQVTVDDSLVMFLTKEL